MFPGYYRFNIRTKNRTRLLGASDESLFLNSDVIRILDEEINQKKTKKP